MSRRLVVITGAGASFDCASELVRTNSERRPPLVKDLFGPDFADILERYPLAQAAAASIRRATGAKNEDAVPLERFLKEQMRDSANRFTRLRYRQIPLYLQHLLYVAGLTDGSGYTREPDNYNALINGALEFDNVLFLTLNYDTLLDDRLFIYWPLESLRSYVASDPMWALVKLHGSVNWSRQVAIDPPVGSEFRLDDRERESPHRHSREAPICERHRASR